MPASRPAVGLARLALRRSGAALAGGLLFATLVGLAGCSVRRLAIDGLAGALAGSQDVFATDDDPELVRDALPFGLKTIEALILESPENEELLLAACRGFTQYSNAFIEADARRAEQDDWQRAEHLRTRALNMYLRARGYGLRALELRHPGITRELELQPERAVARFRGGDLDRVYWTAAAWGSAIALGLDRPELAADVDSMRAMFRRVLELDEGYGDGAIHETLISIEALPELMGGSLERARYHFERALELTQGRSAGTYVSFAANVCIGSQDRVEFERVLELALAVDPDAEPELRLVNLLAQERARELRAAADDLFLEPLE